MNALARVLAGEVGTRVMSRLRLRAAADAPRQVHLSVTDRCFLPCAHCDIYKNEAEDLPEATWARVIDELAAWTGPAAMNFVGGEPLLRKDLERLMARAVKLGFTVTFNTNGWLLTDARAEALRDAGVSVAYLSLDGFKESTVDRSRGRAGSHRKVIEACDQLDRVGTPRVIIASILHAGNATELPDLLGWVKSRGYELVVQPLYQNFGNNAHDPAWFRRSAMWPSPAQLPEIDAALDVLIEERRAWGKVCNSVEQLLAFKLHFRDPSIDNGQVCKAGHSDLAFDPAGNVRLCYFLEPVGRVDDGRSLAAIWNAAETMRRRHEVHRCTRSCNLLNCNFDGGG
ncbi:MAG: radical SAM protein [Deltaproteobacteria bacterium]|nr:radical SAM protein [Deltaproteobacteria bacterium]